MTTTRKAARMAEFGPRPMRVEERACACGCGREFTTAVTNSRLYYEAKCYAVKSRHPNAQSLAIQRVCDRILVTGEAARGVSLSKLKATHAKAMRGVKPARSKRSNIGRVE